MEGERAECHILPEIRNEATGIRDGGRRRKKEESETRKNCLKNAIKICSSL